MTSSPTRRVALAAGEAGAAERDALVERHPVADLGGLADHDAGAVVDEEVARRSAPPGWISIPVTARLANAIARGASGTRPRTARATTRWASSACTPAQLERISSVPTPRAAGSRSRAAATSQRISCATRRNVSSPEHRQSRDEERQRHVALAAVAGDRDDPLAGHLGPRGELERGVEARRRPRSRPAAPRARRRARAASSAVSSSTAITSSITDAVEDLGDEAGADALDLVRARRRRPRAPPRWPARPRRRGRPGRRSLSTWPTPVIVPPVPTPATSASTSPSSVAPDLLRGRAPVDLGVGRVGELLGHERAALGDDLARRAGSPRPSRPATASRGPRRRRRAAAWSARGSSPPAG